MWRQILKLKELAKSFYRKELGNGRHTSFWFDNWSGKGVLADLLGDKGIIDLGMSRSAMVEDAVMCVRRRRRHRTSILNEVEVELNSIALSLNADRSDGSLWRRSSGFKKNFSSNETWEILRAQKPKCDRSDGIWSSQATLKFTFIAWLAARDRLSTLDRVAKWSQGLDTTCVLCKAGMESRDHLFFDCSYAAQIWENTVRGILGNSFTTNWYELVRIMNDKSLGKKRLFCIRYAFQAVLYATGESVISLDMETNCCLCQWLKDRLIKEYETESVC